ncbi:hypothetical protein [Labedaea rhizosphaerae]|uniref:Lactococcin 972 family bacteriocin n=1 Tax=Labedaea rhizosphaerae TaxID=598644 RepID=A0A4R6S7V0_LABRH|nr:hypothetical protein [Labedaea rhizosphaerae]TDP94895.1 hypothetical protein EV186_105127 [Labedaea rhizosphaerae]
MPSLSPVLRRAAAVAAGCALAVTMTGGPASATGKLGHMFTYTYYSSSAHTGEPVGGYVYGYCPSYFSSTWGVRTAYFTSTVEEC